jgi:hypothetical protein
MAQEMLEGPINEPTHKVLVNERILEMYGWTAERLREPVPDNDYGLKWQKNVKQYFKEAYGYRQGGIGGLSKFDHMVNMIKLDLPFFQFESMGYINSAALRVIYALCKHVDLGIAGAASAGKTFPVGAYVLQDWKSAPHATLSFVCTTSLGASEDRIWGAIVKMWQNSVYKIGTYVAHKAVIVYGSFSESATDRDFNSAIKAIAIPKGEDGKKSIGNFRGRKQLNMRLIYDELPEMDRYVTEGIMNLESNTPDSRINAFGLQVVGIGNPMDPNDAHGQMCKPKDPKGYASISKDTKEWETRTGHAIFLNGLWSPNFEAPPGDPIPFPRLTNRIGLANMFKRAHNNENSLEYWRNAIGFWPSAQVSRTVLTKELIIEKNAHRGSDIKIVWRPGKRKVLCGFDIGWTAGGDSCVAQFVEIGQVDGGRTIINWLAESVYLPEMNVEFEDSIAQQVVDECRRRGVTPDQFGMDISGDGGKMLRAIIRYWLKHDPNAAEIVPISSMGSPSERIFSNVDPRPCDKVFDRRVTEYWMMVREGVLCEVIKGIPLVNENTEQTHDIVDQFSTRTYVIKNKKFSIETKVEMKDRTQGRSPDNADGFSYVVEMARRHGLTFNTPDDTKKVEQRRSERIKQDREMSQDKAYASDGWGEDDEEVARAA